MEEFFGRDPGNRYGLVELRPGEIHVASEPTFITTLLGSCVSVCLYSLDDGVGGMSHSVLPSNPYYKGYAHDVRYVETAIDRMIAEFRSLGVQPHRLSAKMFGGAEMFRKDCEAVRIARLVGDCNTKAARDRLGAHGIDVVSECIGGNTGRKLIFNTETGVVFVRRLEARTGAFDIAELEGRAS